MIVSPGSEQYWAEVVSKDKEILAQMETLVAENPDLFSKRDIDFTKKFINFMEGIFRYDNLKLGEHKEKVTRLVRVHRNIPTSELDYYGYNYLIFSGLYIVSDVMFLNPSICRHYFSNQGNSELVKDDDIPDDVIKSTIRYVLDDSGKEMAVALLKSDQVSRYVNDSCPSKWSYPIF